MLWTPFTSYVIRDMTVLTSHCSHCFNEEQRLGENLFKVMLSLAIALNCKSRSATFQPVSDHISIFVAWKLFPFEANITGT